MTGDEDLVAALAAKGIRTVEELLARMETLERSDVWVFVTHDEDDLERPINATGIFPDEHTAFLAGEEYKRTWDERMQEPGEPGVVCKAIPLFIERGKIVAD